MANVTGWNELMQGKVAESAYTVLNTSTFGYFPVILYFILIFVIYIRTRSLALILMLQLVSLGLFWSFFSESGVSIVIGVMAVTGGLWMWQMWANR